MLIYLKAVATAGPDYENWTFAGREIVRKSLTVAILTASALLGGCDNMSTGQKGAVAGGALGTGIGMVAGGSFGQVVGAGLIGGAVGYVGGSAIGNGK